MARTTTIAKPLRPTNVDIVGFEATRYELFVLMKHWQLHWLDYYFAGFCGDESQDNEEAGKIMHILSDRQSDIREAIGHDAASVAIREAFSEFTKGMDPRLIESFAAYIHES